MTLTYKSYADLAADIAAQIARVPKDVDLVVGATRAGIIPACIIGQFLNIPVIPLSEFTSGAASISDVKVVHGRILLVDDEAGDGSAMERALSSAEKMLPAERVRFTAVYYTMARHRDVGLVPLGIPCVFQWNYRNHPIAAQSCYALDGVLRAGGQPLYIPQHRIHTIVCEQPEDARGETEDWLRRHGVRYGRLQMLDQAGKTPAAFKADAYSYDKEAVLFFEGDPKQAAEIAAATAKPVICCSDDSFHLHNAAGQGSGGGSRKNYLGFTHPLKR